MLSQDSEDEIRSRFVFELAIRLWQDELNPRVRCAFGNVWIVQPGLPIVTTAQKVAGTYLSSACTVEVGGLAW